MKQRELEIPEASFERRNRQTSWLVSFIFHVALLLPLFLITCSPSTEPEDLTLIEWGGSGGIPGLDAPIGKTPKGETDGGDKSQPVTETNQPKQTTEQSTPPSQATEKPTNSPSQEKISAKEQPSSRQDPRTDTKQESSSSQETSSNAGTNNNPDKPQGDPSGDGDKPAGGGGGSSVGIAGGGIGRCWNTSPGAAARGATTTQSGSVTLAFTVKADGQVTNIRKVSGATALFSKAQSLLSRARACRAEPGTPDVQAQITYNFTLN